MIEQRYQITAVLARTLHFICLNVTFIQLGKSVKNTFLFTMTADDTGPIVRRPMGLPITARHRLDLNQGVCSDAF